MNIIQDTIYGALLLSIFDFIACFFVLYFIGLFIKALPLLNGAKKKDV
jgi:hypothetical protein